jgi:hypothetical protein
MQVSLFLFSGELIEMPWDKVRKYNVRKVLFLHCAAGRDNHIPKTQGSIGRSRMSEWAYVADGKVLELHEENDVSD